MTFTVFSFLVVVVLFCSVVVVVVTIFVAVIRAAGHCAVATLSLLCECYDCCCLCPSLLVAVVVGNFFLLLLMSCLVIQLPLESLLCGCPSHSSTWMLVHQNSYPKSALKSAPKLRNNACTVPERRGHKGFVSGFRSWLVVCTLSSIFVHHVGDAAGSVSVAVVLCMGLPCRWYFGLLVVLCLIIFER